MPGSCASRLRGERSGDQDLRAVLHQPDDVVGTDAAVDLDLRLRAGLVDAPPQGGDLRKDGGDEALPSEAGVHRHEKDIVQLREDLVQGADRCCGVQGDARGGPGFPDEMHRPVQVRHRLLMHGDHVGAGPREALDEAVRPLDHQVHVQRQIRLLVDRLHHQGTDRQVRDEVAVHDVQVEQPRPARLRGGDLLRQARQIGRQDRGRERRRLRQAPPGARRITLLLPGIASHRPDLLRRR